MNMGTKRHHDKWLQLSEELKVLGCFAMTELGHGSNVRCMCSALTQLYHTNKTWDAGLGCTGPMHLILPAAEYLL